MITIKNYISMIYDDFREYIDQNVNLCMLKTLNYQAGQKPDYSDIHIQQLYLLRYVFSYAFEYKSMFDTLFAREKFKDSIEVASIGCGNMIDTFYSFHKCRLLIRGNVDNSSFHLLHVSTKAGGKRKRSK